MFVENTDSLIILTIGLLKNRRIGEVPEVFCLRSKLQCLVFSSRDRLLDSHLTSSPLKYPRKPANNIRHCDHFCSNKFIPKGLHCATSIGR